MRKEVAERPRVFYGWWVLVAAAVAVFLSAGPGSWTFTVVVVPMAQDLGVSITKVVGALTVSQLLGTVCAPLIGRMADRYGARMTITAGLLVSAASLFVASRANSLWQFYLTYGIGMGLSHVAIRQVGASVVAANWFLRWRGIAFAVPLAASAAGGMVYAPLMEVVVTRWGWHAAWLWSSLAIVVLGLPLAALVIRRRPEDMGLRPDGTTNGAGELEVATMRVRDDSWTLAEASRTRTFWLLNLALPLTGFAGGTIVALLHPYLTHAGMDPSSAARLVSVYAASALAGTPLVAMLVQAFSVRRVFAPLTAFYGLTITGFLLASHAAFPIVAISIIALGLGVSSSSPLGSQVWADYYGRQSIGSIIGAAAIIRAMPPALGPLFAAVVFDYFGSYVPAFGAFAVFCLAASVLLAFAKPPRKAATQPTHMSM